MDLLSEEGQTFCSSYFPTGPSLLFNYLWLVSGRTLWNTQRKKVIPFISTGCGHPATSEYLTNSEYLRDDSVPTTRDYYSPPVLFLYLLQSLIQLIRFTDNCDDIHIAVARKPDRAPTPPAEIQVNEPAYISHMQNIQYPFFFCIR